MKKNRYEKIVFEVNEEITLEVSAEVGTNFEISEGKNGELVIKVLRNYVVSSYSENYVNPPIPKQYKYVEGKWDNGFVIEKCSNGSQFIWIPVGYLDFDGTLDGVNFFEKFGRRNYSKDIFSEKEFNENLNNELLKQFESVKKYGGFYISRYNISQSPNGTPQSVKDFLPWVNVSFNDAKRIASTIENNDDVTSHLVFGAEYDSVLSWLIKSKIKSFEEITEDSTKLGNYLNTKYSTKILAKTGSREEWSVNKIYDLAGNVSEWTQEIYDNKGRVIRGGFFESNGFILPLNYRYYSYPNNSYEFVGFRAALTLS